MNSKRWWLALLPLTGCASAPAPGPERPALAEVRSEYLAAAAVPAIQAHASAPLHEAEHAIGAAAATADPEEFEHQLYKARRYLEIAQAETNRELSREVVAQLTRERNRLRLDLQAVEQAEANRRTQALEAELAALEASRVDRGLQVTLGDMLFEPGRTALTPRADEAVDTLARFLREHPNRTALVEGHTDARGEPEFNRVLSERRAESVKEALVARGVAAERIITRGFGASRPIAGQNTESGRQLNRRVEVVILAEEQEEAGNGQVPR